MAGSLVTLPVLEVAWSWPEVFHIPVGVAPALETVPLMLVWVGV